MIHTQINWEDIGITAVLGCFSPDDGGDAEYHVMIEINATYEKAEEQYRLLEVAVQRLIKLPELKKATLVWKHFYVSGAINQAPYLTTSTGEAVSVVQQPPLNGSKASLWLYFVENVQVSNEQDSTTVMIRPHYKHLISTQLHQRNVVESNSPLLPHPASIEHQTNRVFDRYTQNLSRYDCTLERNCIRTWVFVQDVDIQYTGMVVARRQFFEHEGLTNQTHFIASTGIEGRYVFPEVLVLMDAYAIDGINPVQIKYLQATTHLNPTYEYGVTFERGTAVDYGDRRHIFISGTASINHLGEIVHSLDVEKQTARTFENIQALLSDGDATMEDIACMIVYLRDTADYAVVDRYIKTHYPHIPRITVLAPVCRPGWIVEVECLAIKPIKNSMFATF